MKTTIENGFIVERDTEGRMIYALLLSEVTEIERGDIVTSTFKTSINHTCVKGRNGQGHVYRCAIEHVWSLIHA